MKNFILFLLLFPLFAGATKYYCSPTGSNGNPGTIGSPKFSPAGIWSSLQPGDTLYMRGGTYSMSAQLDLSGKSGTAGNLIKVWNYPGEVPILDFRNVVIGSYKAAWRMTGNYIHLKGIEIKNYHTITAGTFGYGLYPYSVNNCIFEQLNIHHCDCGFRLWGNSTGNVINNCDFHHNSDPSSPSPYGNGDGCSVACAEFNYQTGGVDYYYTNTSNTVINCRSWYNSDDGFDFMFNDGFVEIINCWTWLNGYRPGLWDTDTPSLSGGGNGTGIKLGGHVGSNAYWTTYKRKVQGCVVALNTGNGIDQNNTRSVAYLYDNTCYKNGLVGIRMASYDPVENHQHIATNNLSYLNGESNVYIYRSSTLTTNTFKFNTSGVECVANSTLCTLSDADFQSTDYTQLARPRKQNGSLPDITFLVLRPDSDMLNICTPITGISYTGTAPDMGAFEFVPAYIAPEVTKIIKTGDKAPVVNGKVIVR